MKHNTEASGLCAALLAFAIGFGGTACMVTGLDLPADLWLLAGGCAAGALICTICLSLRHGGLILGAVAAVYCPLIFFSTRILKQFRSLCYRAFTYYNRAYGISIPAWMGTASNESTLLPLLLIAGLVMTVVVFTILRRKPALPAVLAAILPLATCLVVTDTVPDTSCIFLLLLGIVMLMMTQSVRRRDAQQGNKLTGILILPVAIALSSLMLLVPRNQYSAPEHIGTMQNTLDWMLQRIPMVQQTTQGELVISFGGNAKDKINLTGTGNRVQLNTPVMEFTADYNGTVYLRGRDYDVYTGLGWESTAGRTESGYGPTSSWYRERHNASIRVMGRRGQYYLPCYPMQQHTLIDGMLPNPDYINTYSYGFAPLRSNWLSLWRQLHSGLRGTVPVTPPDTGDQYLKLPEQTRLQAKELLEQAFSSPEHGVTSIPDLPSKAEQIERFVRNSASYDLNPGRMPGSEPDFALWFLKNCDTGYCVHFATSATVLLRAAGIPARYVEGYMVQTNADSTTVVREKHAHAWVEYYLDDIGWVIMDPTPGIRDTEPTPGPTETTGNTTPTSPSTEPPVTEPSVTDPEGTEGMPQPGETTDTRPPLIILPGEGESPGTWQMPTWLKTLLWTMVWLTAATLMTVGQWLLRRYLTQRKIHQGSINTQALAHYRQARYLSHISKIPIPPQLKELAEKAKFSQYTLTREELSQFDEFLHSCVQALRQRPWYFRLICRLVFAAY